MVVSKEGESEVSSTRQAVKRAKLAAGKVATLTNAQRIAVVERIAEALDQNRSKIFAANREDLLNAEKLIESGDITQSLADRLLLDESKLASLIGGIKRIAQLPDPLGKVELARQLDQGLVLRRITCPIGLIGVIFEARPDALPQIASLCLRSGNGVILKGGAEAEQSIRVLFDCIQQAAEQEGVPADALVLLNSRSQVTEILAAENEIDLIIPRGSSALVRHIQQNTNIPVLGHAEGICHIYVDASADLDKALRIILDSKTQYPAACNSVETVLIHKDASVKFLPLLAAKLVREGVRLKCDKHTSVELPSKINAEVISEDEWSTEYGDLVLALKTVDSIEAAITHINQFGSNHTDAMIGEDASAFEQFFAQVNSAGVFLNASTRFADGFRYGFGAEVGISTNKQHPRGPVGIEGLVTYKYKLEGGGHVVADYTGTDAKAFTHRELKSETNQEEG